MNDEVSDSRLKILFQKHLAKHPEYVSLRGIKLCGSQVNPSATHVSLMRDKNSSKVKFTNALTCKSAWACPSCSAKVMAMKGTDIAAAIDALSSWYKQDCFMVTLTMPHTNKMTCASSFELLRQTWRYFTRQGCRSGHVYKNKKNEIKHRGKDPYGKFREDLGIRYNCRVYEATWSEEFAWHPHLHVLFWVPRENFNKVLSYEDALMERWWKCLKICAKRLLKARWVKKLKLDGKQFDSKELDKEIQGIIDSYYTDWRKNPVTGHKSVFMSKNVDGSLRKTSSSMYISGWGGDSETSAEKTKTPKDGHYTPYQIINNALIDVANREKWLNLYTEYALATRNHRRVEFASRSGITQIIQKWKATEQYKLALKKRLTEKATEWETVYKFTKYQWQQIYYSDVYSHVYIRSELLELAKIRGAPEVHIRNLLRFYNIEEREYSAHKTTSA